MDKNRVEVVIDGQIITLVSDEQEEYMQKVGLYIDKKLNEIKSTKSNKPVSEHLRTLLISVNIADDYFKAVEKRQALEDTHEAYVHEMGRMQEENILLTEKLHELQAHISHQREQHVNEAGYLQEENTGLAKRVEDLQIQLEQIGGSTVEQEELRQEAARLADVNRDLQEQLQYARNELDEYISTFDDNLQDDRKNVVSFGGR